MLNRAASRMAGMPQPAHLRGVSLHNPRTSRSRDMKRQWNETPRRKRPAFRAEIQAMIVESPVRPMPEEETAPPPVAEKLKKKKARRSPGFLAMTAAALLAGSFGASPRRRTKR